MNVIWFIIGIVAGVFLTAVIIKIFLPKMMLKIYKSKYGVDETAEKLEEVFKAKGWKIPKVYDIQNTLKESGYDDMKKIKILSVCQPDHAHQILLDDDRKRVTALMPCRVGVYETDSGEVRIVEMNVGLMSRLFGGVIKDTMRKVSSEEEQVLKSVTA